MHVQNAPATVALPAHSHSMTNAMLFRSVERVVIGIPQSVTEDLHVPRAHRVVQVWGKLEEAPTHILHNLFSTPKFTVRGVQNDLGVDTILKLFGFALLKMLDARAHGLFHLAVDGLYISRVAT